MQGYLWFVWKRVLQLLAVVFFGVSATFLVTHLSPIDPVEAALGRMTARSVSNPEAIVAMRAALTELYGVEAPIWDQYVNFWGRMLRGDLGPSLLAFPTPAMTLVMRAMPWTVTLLTVATLITFVVGNILGGLAGYYQNNKFLKAFGLGHRRLSKI